MEKVRPYLDQVLAFPGTEQADWLAAFREKNPSLAELLQSLLADLEKRSAGKRHYRWAQAWTYQIEVSPGAALATHAWTVR